jgi:uncharacterized protein
VSLPVASTSPRKIVWSGTRTPSLDYCCVTSDERGWRFSGILVAKFQINPFGAHYEILVDKMFKTRKLVVEKMEAGKTTILEVEFRDGVWIVDGKRRTDLSECKDVDLEASPVTNTLPIRRTSLEIGERVDLTAAWVRFPSLVVAPLEQSYERLGARKYLYRSASGFAAELEVDDFSLVTRYGDIWTEIV